MWLVGDGQKGMQLQAQSEKLPVALWALHGSLGIAISLDSWTVEG
jgi:hypothetical protein